MKARILLFIGIGLMSLLMFVGSTGFVQSKQSVWEYKVLEGNWEEQQLNSLGGAGWELVAVDASRGDHVRAFFKRQR